MMAPSDFVAGWEQFKATNPILANDEDYNLRAAKADDIRLDGLPPLARQFLLEAGLPKSFSALIRFEDISEGLKRIWEVYSPLAWTPEEKEDLKMYLLIGADEEDNPICLDESKNGEIVVLDHDNDFRVWRFVNSSLNQLGESLLAIASGASGERLKTLLNAIDPPAIKEGTFWWAHSL